MQPQLSELWDRNMTQDEQRLDLDRATIILGIGCAAALLLTIVWVGGLLS